MVKKASGCQQNTDTTTTAFDHAKTRTSLRPSVSATSLGGPKITKGTSRLLPHIDSPADPCSQTPPPCRRHCLKKLGVQLIQDVSAETNKVLSNGTTTTAVQQPTRTRRRGRRPTGLPLAPITKLSFGVSVAPPAGVVEAPRGPPPHPGLLPPSPPPLLPSACPRLAGGLYVHKVPAPIDDARVAQHRLRYRHRMPTPQPYPSRASHPPRKASQPPHRLSILSTRHPPPRRRAATLLPAQRLIPPPPFDLPDTDPIVPSLPFDATAWRHALLDAGECLDAHSAIPAAGGALSSMRESAWMFVHAGLIPSMLLDAAAWKRSLLDAGECVDVCTRRSHPLHAARCGGVETQSPRCGRVCGCMQGAPVSSPPSTLLDAAVWRCTLLDAVEGSLEENPRLGGEAGEAGLGMGNRSIEVWDVVL
ncbi:hypothetical protein DFP72DRAFT_1092409 [Ephemerocybe angulata]|uniref:Uncharacterized protein n=1 Tax=Ephemerocybe angulata TaxID=980116 RepID=A0A8H6IB53_9AGAR|nr:hypothetical protein DFP72DRAFT_1092409 [Tulosesus angulatus]